MDTSDALSDMPITKLVQAWVAEKGWEDRPQILNNERSTTASTFEVDGQIYKTYFEAYEDQDVLALYVYFPFIVPSEKTTDMAMLLNRINGSFSYGRFCFVERDGSERLQYANSIDIEGGSLTTDQIDVMLRRGLNYVGEFVHAIAARVFTTLTLEQILEEHRARREAKESSAGDELLN